MIENTTTRTPAELQQQAEAGDAKAQFELACHYADQRNVKPNEELALLWLTKAAENGLANAELALGYAYCNPKFIREQMSENARDNEWMQYSIDAGCAGEHIPFFVGFGPANRRAGDDPATAFLWFSKSAEKGNSEALYWVGRCYEWGIGVAQNEEQAFDAYKKSADQDFGLAFEKVAQCYFKGQGVEQDDIQAADWYFKASKPWSIDLQLFEGCERAKQWLIEHGYSIALRHLERGEYKRGMAWMVETVIDGNIDAGNWPINKYLSLALPKGLNKETEERFFCDAFNLCHNELNGENAPEANLLLGVLYLSGRGVEQNHRRAFECFSEADRLNGEPQQGDKNEWLSSFIRLFLLICLAQGKGVEKNLERARKYQKFIDYDFKALGRMLVNGLSTMSVEIMPNNRSFIDYLIVSSYIENKECERAKQYIENPEGEDAMGVYVKKLFLDKIEGNKQLTEAKNKLLEKEKELEETMAMFAHKFRSPLDAIIYNTTHDNQPTLYTEAAQTMRGLLDVFSIISTDEIVLKAKLQQDNQGNSNLMTVFSTTLDMIMLHLLSVSASEKIQQHYMAYAKAQGLCDAEVSYKSWDEDFFELERKLQSEWQQAYAQLLSESADLDARLRWLEQHFFKLELTGFDYANIHFKEYGITASFLTILLNEILVNAFKYYSSVDKQPVALQWLEHDGYQVLSCCNPSIQDERTMIKGSRKGHAFLSALARKTECQFNKPIPADNFVVEFGIPNELLLN